MGNPLQDAYRKSTYRYCDGAGVVALRIGEPCAELRRLLRERGVASAAYITAWNPRSVPVAFAVNRARNERLEAEIRSMGFDCLAGEGGLDGWFEESFLVPGIGLDDAHDLALRHGQYAFVFSGEDGLPELVMTVEA